MDLIPKFVSCFISKNTLRTFQFFNGVLWERHILKGFLGAQQQRRRAVEPRCLQFILMAFTLLRTVRLGHNRELEPSSCEKNWWKSLHVSHVSFVRIGTKQKRINHMDESQHGWLDFFTGAAWREVPDCVQLSAVWRYLFSRSWIRLYASVSDVLLLFFVCCFPR